MLRHCFIALIGSLFAVAAHAQDGSRLALLIANEDYPGAPQALSYPSRDAATLRAALEEADFDVTVIEDADGEDILDAVAVFAEALDAAGSDAVGFFYYAGHGAVGYAEGRARNFMMPAGAEIRSEATLVQRGVRLDRQIDAMATAGASALFVVYDACRNPLNRGETRGFAPPSARSGLLIAMSTTDGSTTPDDGRYAAALAAQLRLPGQRAVVAFSNASAEVGLARQQQGRENEFPELSPRLTGPFCFRGCGDGDAEIVTPPPLREPDGWLYLGDLDVNGAWAEGPFMAPASPYGELVRGARFQLDRVREAHIRTAPADAEEDNILGRLALGATFQVLTRSRIDLDAGGSAVWARVAVIDRELYSPVAANVGARDAADGPTPFDEPPPPDPAAAVFEGVTSPVGGVAIRDGATITAATPPGVVFADRIAGGQGAVAIGPEMVVLPPGAFTMGSPANEEGRDDDEGPQRRVTLATAFAVGRFEATFAEWEACVRGGGCTSTPAPNEGGWGRGRRPVIHVSWNDAQEYVYWLSAATGEEYRLLSEAEWEYAARAERDAVYHPRFSWGDADPVCDRSAPNGANFNACSDSRTHEVGSYRPNAFGLYDMHGNVYEWTQDCLNDSYADAPTDGRAWESGNCSRRVLRGGSWLSTPQNLRSASRSWDTTDARIYDGGFRVARTISP